MDESRQDQYNTNPGTTLLLVGKTGSGISSTCKSIDIASEARQFGGFASVSHDIETGKIELEDIKITVVATPGVCQGTETSQSAYFQNVICEGFQHAPAGFHAVVLVLSYMERIDYEFTRTIQNLQSVLGKNTMENHGVLLITGADCLFRDLGEETVVERWGQDQTGFFKQLYDQCNSRCVLFDNVTDDEEKNKSQLKKLVSNVQQVKDKVYTYDKFASANLVFINEGNLLPLIECRLSKEYLRLRNWFKWEGLQKLSHEIRMKVLDKQEKAMNEILHDIKINHKRTRIISLNNVVRNLSILMDLTKKPTNKKEYDRKMKEFKDGMEETFKSLKVPFWKRLGLHSRGS